MPHFEPFFLVKWIHVAALAVGGGASVVALLLSGLEDAREDLRGLAANVWRRVVAWPFRLAALLGLLLLLLQYRAGNPDPFGPRHLHIKLVLVLALLAFSELAPKALAAGKRGAALLALLFFLLASFVAVNAGAFPRRPRTAEEPALLQAR